MEILVISHKYPPSIGGMQKQCYELVQGLKKRHTVIELIHKGGAKVPFLLLASVRAAILLKRNPKVELVYANDGLMAFFLTPLFWMTKVPVAITAHGLDVVFPMKFYQRWLPKYFNKARAVIAVSEGTTQELLDRNISRERVFTVRNGFDPKEGKSQVTENTLLEREIDITKKKVIVSIGRSVERKGFSWFVTNVMPKLGEDVVYLIIGPRLGDHHKLQRMRKLLPPSIFKSLVLLNGIPLDEITLVEKIQELNFQDRVFHVSGLSNEEVTSVLKSADLYAMPNIPVTGDYEGFGLVALEAVTAGLLCVASEVDGIPSAIQDKQNGILLPPGDVASWVEEITHWLGNPDERKELASRFRANAVNDCLSWQDMAAAYEEVFLKVLESKE